MWKSKGRSTLIASSRVHQIRPQLAATSFKSVRRNWGVVRGTLARVKVGPALAICFIKSLFNVRQLALQFSIRRVRPYLREPIPNPNSGFVLIEPEVVYGDPYQVSVFGSSFQLRYVVRQFLILKLSLIVPQSGKLSSVFPNLILRRKDSSSVSTDALPIAMRTLKTRLAGSRKSKTLPYRFVFVISKYRFEIRFI